MIEKMERIFLCGLAQDQEGIINRLMKSGCVQLNAPGAMSGYEEIKDQVELGSADVYEREQTLSRLNQCIQALGPYGAKKGLFSKRPEVNYWTVAGGAFISAALETCDRVEELQKEMAAAKSRISQEEFLQLSLAPWQKFDLPLEETATASSEILMAAVPITVTEAELEAKQEEQGLGAYLSVVSEDKDQRYVAVVVHKSRSAEYQELLRQCGAASISFRDLTGTAGENISASKARVKGEEETLEKLNQELSSLGKKLPDV